MTRHITGAERQRIARDLAEKYQTPGASLRDLAAATGRSASNIRTLLLEAGVQLRPVGARRTTTGSNTDT